jgi:hypothetical protein
MPCPFGPDLVQRDVAVSHRDRIDPVAGVRGEIAFLDQSTGLARMSRDRSGEFAAIERLALAFSDQPQRLCLPRTDEALARQRRAAMRREGFAIAGMRQQLVHLSLPLPMHGRRDEVAVGGVADRRLEQIGEGQAAEAVRQRAPRRDRARHCHRIPAAHGNGVSALEVRRRHFPRRAARGVEAVQLAPSPDQRECVAADAVLARLDHRQRDRGGERGIHCVAAAQEHCEPGRRGQRLRGADHIGGKQWHALRGVGKIPEFRIVCGHHMSFGESGAPRCARGDICFCTLAYSAADCTRRPPSS